MEEDIKILEEWVEENRDWYCIECGYNCGLNGTKTKHNQAIENLINKYKEQEKIIELAIDELYLFNAYDCDYSDLKEHTCTKNDDDTVEIQKAKCKKCIREIIEKKVRGE